jgi:hypothetical protein
MVILFEVSVRSKSDILRAFSLLSSISSMRGCVQREVAVKPKCKLSVSPILDLKMDLP